MVSEGAVVVVAVGVGVGEVDWLDGSCWLVGDDSEEGSEVEAGVVRYEGGRLER